MLINADKIEKTIWEYIYLSVCAFMKKEIDVTKFIQTYIANNEIVSNNTNNKREKAKNEKERIKIMFQKGYISEDEMIQKYDILEKRLLKLDLEAGEEEKRRFGHLSGIPKKCNEKNAFYIMEEMLNRLDNKGKRLILERLVTEIAVVGKIIMIK
jgi:hypothetical protein